MKVAVKKPGLEMTPIMSELDLTYKVCPAAVTHDPIEDTFTSRSKLTVRTEPSPCCVLSSSKLNCSSVRAASNNVLSWRSSCYPAPALGRA